MVEQKKSGLTMTPQNCGRVIEMELDIRQSALILRESEDGDITVDVASSDIDGLTGSICKAIAKKLMEDEQFLEDLMDSQDSWGSDN